MRMEGVREGGGSGGILRWWFCCKVENNFCRGGPGSRHVARRWPTATWSVHPSCNTGQGGVVEAVAPDLGHSMASQVRNEQEGM